MNEKTKSLLSSIAKFLVAGGIIGWLLAKGLLDPKAVVAVFTSPALVSGLLLLGLNLLLCSERWRLLATVQDVKAGPQEVFRLTLIGTFFNHAIPGGVGGDVVKAYYFGKDHPNARAAAITSVFLDRVLGLYAMVCMAAGVMLLDLDHVSKVPLLSTLGLLLGVLWIAFTIGLIAVFSRRVRTRGWPEAILRLLPFSEKFRKLYETAHGFGLYRQRVILVLAVSVAAQSVSILFLWLAGRAAGYEDVSLMTYFLVSPLGYMATAIPISPAGIGVGQLAFLNLFNLYLGRETGLGPAVITAQQALTLVFGLIGAVVYVRRRDPVPVTPSEVT